MFDIRILPDSEAGPEGERFGRITIGDFSDRFAVYPKPSHGSVDDYPKIWKAKLKELVQGASAVALIHGPRFAWIVYREDESCIVQQKFAIDGSFENISQRETVTEDGRPVSEWFVSLRDIANFIQN